MHLPYFDPRNGSNPSLLIYNLALAIARAEGAFTPGSIPDTRNNPGDLTDENGVIHFLEPNEGWRALFDKLEKIAAGKSRVYDPHWTIQELAVMYVTGGKPAHPGDNPSRWADAVAEFLGVGTDTTIADYCCVPPAVDPVAAAPAPVDITPASAAPPQD